MSNTESTKPAASAQPAKPRPNEQGTISVQAHMRIFDPTTKQVFVEGRA
jgi:hypothetical protein